MAVRLTGPPDSAGELVDSALRSFVTEGHYRLRTLRDRNPGEITRAQAHPVYTLGLEDIVNGRGLDAARLTAWRFLLQERGNTVAAIELAVDLDSGGMSFASVTTGPFVEATSAALGHDLSGLEPEPGDWTVRLLRIPALYLWALWLVEPTAGKDVLSPFSPAPDGIQAGRGYTWPELRQLLLPAARSRLAAGEAGPGVR